MRGNKHVSAAGRHDLDRALHVMLERLQSGEGQHLLHTDAAAPETNVVAKFPFQPDKVHLCGAALDRIQNVAPDLDEVWDEVINGAARMKKNLDRRLRMNEVEDPALPRLDELTVHLGPDLSLCLHSDIVTLRGNLDIVSHLAEEHVPQGYGCP